MLSVPSSAFTFLCSFRPHIVSEKTVFRKVTVQGGGIFKIETQGMGTVLEGETFVVESGGLIDVDKLKVVAHTLTIEDSAIISANAKVKYFIFYFFGLV